MLVTDVKQLQLIQQQCIHGSHCPYSIVVSRWWWWSNIRLLWTAALLIPNIACVHKQFSNKITHVLWQLHSHFTGILYQVCILLKLINKSRAQRQKYQAVTMSTVFVILKTESAISCQGARGNGCPQTLHEVCVWTVMKPSRGTFTV